MTMSIREHEKRYRSRRSRSPRPSPSVFSRIRRERSRSPRQRSNEEGVFKRLRNRGKSVSERSDSYRQHSHSRYTEALSESEDIGGGHWKSKSKKNKSNGEEDDLSQPWVCEEIVPFTPRIRYFDFPKTRMPSHIKTYDRRHNTDECMHLRKQIEEMLKARKLSHLIKDLKQNTGKEQPKTTKKGEASVKDKALAILMVQPWERVARQKITQSFSSNTEIFFPPLDEGEGTEDLMIVEAEIEGHCIHRMYLDGGLALEILYKHYFNRLRSKIKKQLVPSTTPLIGFGGEIIWPIGQIQLLVRIGDEKHSDLARMNFVVVRSPSPYNGIIGRPGVRKLQAIPSTAHGMLKLPVEGGVITLKSSRLIPLECALVSGLGETLQARKPIVEERIQVAINPEYLKQTIMIGSTLTEEGLNKLQKKRGQAADRNQEIQEEVGKLVEADFKDLNKACPKDGYPLLEIDWKDEEKTTFITSQGIFCYTKIPFGLRNAGATYQRLVDKAFHKQISRNLEVYVDDLVIKSCIARVSVKGQLLADFIVERPEEDSSDTLMEVEEKLPEPWILFTDGSSCTDSSGAGLILTNPKGADADSRLVANQVNGTYVAKEVDMIRYPKKVKTLTNSFKAFSIRQIPRNENKKADALSKIASTSFAHLSKQVLVEELKEKSISKVEILAVVEEGDTWMTSIFKYLEEGTLPADVKKARAVRRKSWRFAVVNGTLYKKSFLGPWLRCVGPLQANYVLREIHEGSCSMHTEGPGKVKLLIVAIDYFTKWIEAKPVVTITGNQIKKFVWDNIVCRFGLSREIISDRKQFRDDPFKDWCEKLCIRQHFASVKHPQTNGLTERSNRSLGEGIKARLDARRDLVYRNNDASPKWEGPYEVTEALGKGAYKLRDHDGKQLSRTWNISNLKKCYVHKM
uniref:Integrase catalytic domain-containing protein n=1 Tax=Tanacetum cinerariifolium TaxID=118510 RepID=A0A699GSB9_TANCI|nr:hypothetical protein [Tanacetum cinerariifolium]GEW09776.1 hypothetical protein [Tanacetum cinerariifolium]